MWPGQKCVVIPGPSFTPAAAMTEVSKPCVWTDVPADAVTFKTAVRQNNGGVRVEIDLDKSKLKGASENGLQKMRIQTPRFRRFRIKKSLCTTYRYPALETDSTLCTPHCNPTPFGILLPYSSLRTNESVLTSFAQSTTSTF